MDDLVTGPSTNLPNRRRELTARHAALERHHRALRDRPGELLEQREHHEALKEHQADLAVYETAVQHRSPDERHALSLAKTLEQAEVMLAESGRAVEQGRRAWDHATRVYQKVRELLDKDS